MMEFVLKSEEQNIATLQMEAGDKTGWQSHRIVACLTTSFLFDKSRPHLLVNHVQTLQPYLDVKCQTQGSTRSSATEPGPCSSHLFSF